jgi:predicted DNA repair protein MutK
LKVAATSLLTLLDDIVTVLYRLRCHFTKVAVIKTAGFLRDYLTLNAEQVLGVKAGRDLPVWAVVKGSFINKFI